MRKITFVTIALLFLGLVEPVCAQQFSKPFLNGNPAYWYVGNGGIKYGTAYQGSLDSSVHHSGKYSIRLQSTASPLTREIGQASTVIPISKAKLVRISAWVKTDKVTISTSLWAGNGIVGDFNNTIIPEGTHDWGQYSFDIILDSDAKYLDFGGILAGEGTAWFDDIQVQIDGKDYFADSNALAFGPKINLSDAQIHWLKSNISLLATTDPKASLSDLAPLHDIIGSTKIVGLGEATHGSHECFQMKQRIVEDLAKNFGFTIVAVEADMVQAAAINNYVLHGIGNPDELLRSPYFWNWNTDEMLDLVKWMHGFNASDAGHLQFCGYGIQFITNASAQVQSFLNVHDSSIAPKAQSTYALAKELILRSRSERGYNRDRDDSASWLLAIHDCHELEGHLQSYSASFRQPMNPDSLAWIIQSARVVTQELEEVFGYFSGRYIRDSCLAQNVKWIAEHNPRAKIVLYSYGSQNTKDSLAMGYRLSKLYGNQYKSVGFSFYDGTYLANGTSERSADTAAAGTAEYAFHRLEQPLWMLNLGNVRTTNDTAANWLRQPVSFRMMGGMENNMFTARILSKSFDALIYIDHSNASHLLPSAKY